MINMILISSVIVSVIVLSDAYTARDRIPLSSVTALTLYSDEMTTARRGHAVRQLSCVAGLCDRADLQPDVVQCRSSGLDADGMPQWRCEADLDEGVKLGRISVTCEGYESPNDDYILKGSCGLEYELKKTRHFKEDRSYNNRKGGYYNEDKFDKTQQSSWVSSLIQLCIVLCVARCVYQACCGRSQQNNQNNGPYPPPGDPAPQYPGHDSQQQYYQPQQSYTANSQTFQKQQPSTSSGLSTAATAAAAGGLGYMLGRRSAAPTRTAPRSGWFSGWSTNSSNSTSRTSSNTRTTSRSRPSSSSSSSSSSTRTSTSFGSTKLR